MSLLAYLLLLVLSGLLVGALARLALPGKDPLTIWQTILVGLDGLLRSGPAEPAGLRPQLRGHHAVNPGRNNRHVPRAPLPRRRPAGSGQTP